MADGSCAGASCTAMLMDMSGIRSCLERLFRRVGQIRPGRSAPGRDGPYRSTPLMASDIGRDMDPLAQNAVTADIPRGPRPSASRHGQH
ncbi:hypothetical protein XAB3213_1030007 [Xanthomonas citri pv. bilvae]|nr:hypothetical protein XAB3213_1030007 [Xanthomonas citri pv. bilvae]